MDRKSILILVICFCMLFVMKLATDKFFPPIKVQIPVVVPGSSSNAVIQNFVAAPGATGAFPSTSAGLMVSRDIPEETLVVTNGSARYVFTSRGGGIKEIVLPKFEESINLSKQQKGKPKPLITLNGEGLVPVFSVLGEYAIQGDGAYHLSRTPEGTVRAEKLLTNGLAIIKEFSIGTNYLFGASVKFENRSPQPMNLPGHQLATGTSIPLDSQDKGLDQNVLWYDGAKSHAVSLGYFDTNTTAFFGLKSRVPNTEFKAGDTNVGWVSAQNQFFVLATMPLKPAPAFVAHMANLPPATSEELRENPLTISNQFGIQAALLYPGITLNPGQSVTNIYRVYAGPKEYRTLARLGADYNNDIDLVMNFGLVAPISKTLLLAMNGLQSVLTISYGWIIILITVCIRLLFWPLTQASTRAAKRMQTFQPQIKAIQEKYKDDPQKAQMKQWEFMKENDLTKAQLSGCLPMLLQLPVFMGFYWMLRTAIELRGVPFFWMHDLSKPDTIFNLAIPLHFLGFADRFLSLNPMPLIMGATQLVQAGMMPAAPGMDPSQQKMMKYMPLMMLFFMYSQPAGLVVYWTCSNLLSILQTKITRAQDKGAPATAVKASVVPKKKK